MKQLRLFAPEPATPTTTTHAPRAPQNGAQRATGPSARTSVLTPDVAAARAAYLARCADDLPDDLRAAGMRRDGHAIYDPGPPDRPGYPAATFMRHRTLEANIAAAREALAERARLDALAVERAVKPKKGKARR